MNVSELLECFKNAFQVGRRGPQGLKPAFLLSPGGTAKAVPYPKPIFEVRSKLLCPGDQLRFAQELQLHPSFYREGIHRQTVLPKTESQTQACGSWRRDFIGGLTG